MLPTVELNRQEKEWGCQIDCQPLQLRMLLPMIVAPELPLLHGCIQAPLLYMMQQCLKKITSRSGVMVVQNEPMVKISVNTDILVIRFYENIDKI